jgi:hypothetical protein
MPARHTKSSIPKERKGADYDGHSDRLETQFRGTQLEHTSIVFIEIEQPVLEPIAGCATQEYDVVGIILALGAYAL